MSVICVDIMGSDASPQEMLKGIEHALDANPHLHVIAVGSEDIFADHPLHDRLSVEYASEVIAMDEHPVQAMRKKKDASIVRACKVVAENRADALFSAGSTGAVLTCATFLIGRLEGVARPALAAALPGISGHRTLFFDLGANADVRPDVIAQFAAMGVAYARSIMGVVAPRVGLLCNGSEETKGSETALEYHQVLKTSCPEFAGNAEGSDILAGTFDVIVTDGFSGNIALKSMEGTAKFVLARLKAAQKRSFLVTLGLLLLKKDLLGIAGDLSGDEYGGALLLGLKAPVFKGHGKSSARAVAQGISAAVEALNHDVVGRVAEAIIDYNKEDLT